MPPQPSDTPPAEPEAAPYGVVREAGYPTAATGGRVRTTHLRRWKQEGRRWAMLTAYDRFSAEVFDEAGIPVLLVGDSAANVVYGMASTVPVTVDELLPLVRAVSRCAPRALVVADLPFGSYGASPEQGAATATRFLKEGLAHAVKLEGGADMAPTVALLVRLGIPVMAHLGFTPQSEHALGGYRVQGRGDGADRLLADARALQDAGAFAVVLEMVPASVAARVTESLEIPTVGIGAGAGCDAQVLVWQDMAGLGGPGGPRFVKRYADLRTPLLQAARDYATEVAEGTFPGPEHTFSE
ncbi:3-methyl-2-oxobutanoate hydroxymethyltransferase [Lapillicoccus jejuensis]|uniref:3-methyl-2-oxobutanoate hydroxymethyltransferase n=1 Tax=Lapillicoccus jejuensis TaxID=402171 RepID=A0A542E5W6_9MICO|nr:3-methyl-2-oxobutanoate hydroxymethyltransferase [Lapillicoccus jejuensis]TQJ10732.1 ketopantoate hydroxymethyltransferase [Lapillicoccus jejuensis]